jgi:hypothetical protein
MENHINFCPPFFENSRYLDDQVDWAASNFGVRDLIRAYRNRGTLQSNSTLHQPLSLVATTWAHELLHVSWIGKLVGDEGGINGHMPDEVYLFGGPFGG